MCVSRVVSRVFKGCIKGVTRKFQGSFRIVLWKFQGSFKGCCKDVSSKLKGVSRKFRGCFKEVQEVSRVLRASFKEAC